MADFDMTHEAYQTAIGGLLVSSVEGEAWLW